jgi:Zn-dependent membrane protease YugP
MMNLVWFDYLLIVLPGIGLCVWANVRIARALVSGWRIASRSILTGTEAAEEVLLAGGVTGVAIVTSAGELSNHFDPDRNVLRLSRGVRGGSSLAAIGVGAHEAGHAIQDAAGYPGLVLRNVVVPWTGLGVQVVGVFLAAGLWLGMTRLIVVAIVLFYAILIVQLINVPVELDASRRGRAFLRSTGYVDEEEEPVVGRVLDAVAWTHLAAILTVGFPIVDILGRFSPAPGGPARAGRLTD